MVCYEAVSVEMLRVWSIREAWKKKRTLD